MLWNVGKQLLNATNSYPQKTWIFPLKCLFANSSLIPPFFIAFYACLFLFSCTSFQFYLFSLPSQPSHNLHAPCVRMVASFVFSYPHVGCGIMINDRCVRRITQTECEAWIRFRQHNHHSMVLRVCRVFGEQGTPTFAIIILLNINIHLDYVQDCNCHLKENTVPTHYNTNLLILLLEITVLCN